MGNILCIPLTPKQRERFKSRGTRRRKQTDVAVTEISAESNKSRRQDGKLEREAADMVKEMSKHGDDDTDEGFSVEKLHVQFTDDRGDDTGGIVAVANTDVKCTDVTEDESVTDEDDDYEDDCDDDYDDDNDDIVYGHTMKSTLDTIIQTVDEAATDNQINTKHSCTSEIIDINKQTLECDDDSEHLTHENTKCVSDLASVEDNSRKADNGDGFSKNTLQKEIETTADWVDPESSRSGSTASVTCCFEDEIADSQEASLEAEGLRKVNLLTQDHIEFLMMIGMKPRLKAVDRIRSDSKSEEEMRRSDPIPEEERRGSIRDLKWSRYNRRWGNDSLQSSWEREELERQAGTNSGDDDQSESYMFRGNRRSIGAIKEDDHNRNCRTHSFMPQADDTELGSDERERGGGGGLIRRQSSYLQLTPIDKG